MYTFKQWDDLFRAQKLNSFNDNPLGILWLKVRAICRSRQLKKFLFENHLSLQSTKISECNIELYNILKDRNDSMELLDAFLHDLNNEWYLAKGVDADKLKEDLYKIQYYIWGGDQNNSLDKYLVSRYVKDISDFSILQSKQIEIAGNAWNYVQNSWYNNWTSFLIESLFKRSPKVVSAVGEIKSVDFFINNYPIDLKVTYFPNQFMDSKIKEILGKSPLSWLKNKCKEYGIKSNPTASTSQQMYTLIEKLKESGRGNVLDEFNNTRRQIIEEAQNNPIELITWLYENQGEMRFGAENRLFLILVDPDAFEDSWKMKRAFALIEPKINNYLKDFDSMSLKHIDFEFKQQMYSTLADAIFIVKPFH